MPRLISCGRHPIIMSGMGIYPGDPWSIIRSGPPIKVYFDMDGVLADFAGGLRDMCGIDAPEQGGSNDDLVFEAIRNTPHFYLRLEPNEWMCHLFRMLAHEGNIQCAVLTGIPKPSRGIADAEADKREWVMRYLGPDAEFIPVERRHKADYARGSILIDDYPPNIEEWEAAGGRGILPDSLRGASEWGILRILIDRKIRCFIDGGDVASVRLLSIGSGYCGISPGRCFKTSLSVSAAGNVTYQEWIGEENWGYHIVRKRRRISERKARGAMARMADIALSHDLTADVCDGSSWQLTIKRDDGKKLDIAGFSHMCPKGTDARIARLAESVGFPGCWLF